jgi:hypothetical protein
VWQTILGAFERNQPALLGGGGVALLIAVAIVVALLVSRGEGDSAERMATRTAVVP